VRRYLPGGCAIVCTGCREVFLPEEEIDRLLAVPAARPTGIVRADYLCEEQWAAAYLASADAVISRASAVVVFSCGVGVQTVAGLLPTTAVVPGCDTHYLNGFQGLSPQENDCRQCGECFLNLTAGICPLTACSKGLLNGPCGGSKDGKCEVNPAMQCGWDRVWRRLTAPGRACLPEGKVLVRDYSKILAEIERRKEQT